MERAPQALVQLKVRMREPLRAALETAARERGVSLNAEVVERLQRSMREEEALGGAGMRSIVYQLAASFALASRLGADDRVSPMDDPVRFRRGVAGVVDQLAIGMRPEDIDAVLLDVEGLKSRLLTRRHAEQTARAERPRGQSERSKARRSAA